MATVGSLNVAMVLMVMLAAATVHVMSESEFEFDNRRIHEPPLPFNFTWYQYESFGTGTLNDTIAPLTNSTIGAVEIQDERMTETAEPDSTYYGQSIGPTAYHFHPDNSIHVFLSFTNTIFQPFQGSFSIQGLVNVSKVSNDLAITGGTGYFKLVRGYVTTTGGARFGPGFTVNKWVAYFYWF